MTYAKAPGLSELEGRERVAADSDLKRWECFLLKDWASDPGFENFDPERYWTWIATADVSHLLGFCNNLISRPYAIAGVAPWEESSNEQG